MEEEEEQEKDSSFASLPFPYINYELIQHGTGHLKLLTAAAAVLLCVKDVDNDGLCCALLAGCVSHERTHSAGVLHYTKLYWFSTARPVSLGSLLLLFDVLADDCEVAVAAALLAAAADDDAVVADDDEAPCTPAPVVDDDDCPPCCCCCCCWIVDACCCADAAAAATAACNKLFGSSLVFTRT